MARRIFVNTRVLNLRMAGVQRYVAEMLKRLAPELEEIRPSRAGAGLPGHGWEQGVLPCLVGRQVLWSPANTGPLTVARQVVTIHDVVPLDHPEWLSPRFAALHRWLIPKLARRAARVIASSEFSRRRIIECTGIPADKVSAVPLAADPRFQPQPEAAIQAMIAAQRLPGRNYVLTVGAIEPRKNLPRLLEAWRRVLPRIDPDTWLVVSGEPGRSAVFRETCIENVPARVHFAGYVPDERLPALYTGARVFVYMSLYEGFGLPPLEAMACGTPVITGNRTSLPEVVGDGGLMVDPTDVRAIASALHMVLLDRESRRSLAERGLLRSKRFSWKTTSEMTLQILSEVAAA